jgi:hypothetical protein
MEAIDLEAFDYSDASSAYYFAYRPFGSCKRKIYLQHRTSGSVYSIFINVWIQRVSGLWSWISPRPDWLAGSVLRALSLDLRRSRSW